ncbi:MAG: AmmeMemoRadiSam system radical SAM enzyme [Candidatus Hodarchaeota archaeon]
MNLLGEKRIASLYEPLPQRKVLCKLCPRGCKMNDGKRGFCGTRQNIGGDLYTLVYGKAVRVAQEFMETEGVFHFAPGSPILSIGNMGCNLYCKFCQNWKTSQMKYIDENDFEFYTPKQIVNLALNKDISVLSWTYNDPVVWHEFVMDTARLARQKGLVNLYKSAFYITLDAVKELCEVIDIFSLSLKSIREDFYRKHATGTLPPILENIRYVYHTGIHLELSNLMVTDLNDSEEDARAVAQWHLENTSADVPLHFVRFHPAYQYKDVPRTPIDRLERARKIALEMGVKYCYIGNVYDSDGGNSFCPECHSLLIKRYDINTEIIDLNDDGKCTNCGYQTNIKAKPFESVMKKIDDDHYKYQSKEVYRWSEEVNRLHIEATNSKKIGSEVTIYRLGHGDTSSLKALKTNILPQETNRFIVSKSKPEETGVVICYQPDLKIRISELLDRAHLPTEFKEGKRRISPQKIGLKEKLKLFLPWETGLPSWASKNITYPTYLKLKGLRILEFLQELEKSQWYGVEQIRALQIRKLKALLIHCQMYVPYYQEIFNSLGFNPEHVKALDDIQRLPFLEKQDFIKNTEKIKTTAKNFPFHKAETSGSTGIPMSLLTDYNSMARSIAARIRAERWWNMDYGLKELHFWGRGFTEPSLRLRITDLLFRNKIVLSTVNLKTEILYDHYKKLVRFNPDIIYGNPSAVYLFARFVEENKLDVSMLRTKALISTTEILHEYQRHFLHSMFKCPVINEYGAAEVGIIAFECPNHNMHLFTDNLIVEILKDGKPAGPNEFGEIIVTNLNNYIMPFIRYKIGDVGRFIAGKCPCGVKLPLIDLTIGRDCDTIVLEDRELPGAVLFGCLGKELLNFTNGGLKAYKIFQRDLTHFKFQYVLRDDGVRDRIELETKRIVREVLGPHIQLEFEYLDDIPREESGKLRYFVSEVLG